MSRQFGRGARGALLLLLVSPLAGCASLFNQPANVEATRADVESLRREQTELVALVRELKARMESQSDAVSQLRADNNLQLRQLEEKLDVLSARLDELGARPSRPTQGTATPVTPPAPAPGGNTANPTEGGGATSPGVPPSDPQAVFDAANRDYAKGNYELAAAGFQEYLKEAPDSPQADDAQYWIGECYYGLQQWDRAVQEFLKVRDLYSGGDKVAAATYKIGLTFIRKNDNATARRYLETVVREFPGSEEARLAQDKLKTLQ
jgi:tol-pal system protein YbgF